MTVMKALEAIDEAVRKATGGGAEGTGLFNLLDNLATTTLGVPRSTFPAEAPAAPPAAPPAASPAADAAKVEETPRGRR